MRRWACGQRILRHGSPESDSPPTATVPSSTPDGLEWANPHGPGRRARPAAARGYWAAGPEPYAPRPGQAHSDEQRKKKKKGTAWQGFGQGYARWAPSWQWRWQPRDAAAPEASGRKSAPPRPPRGGPR
ncbi:hypothetical protein GCM10010498_23290 [Streptomyces cavourensis]|nr:hypothetical protein GCM10010498_23290 [Streptomyces cavourensis]